METSDFIFLSHEISRFGEYPGHRPIEKLLASGIVILDKWPGPTSRDVSAQVRKLLGTTKAAHAGTLDPAVSGVLPVLVGAATKILPALQKQDKEYVGIMKLHRDVDDASLQTAIAKSTGTITQTPPVRSAVARRPRQRTVHSFTVLERSGRDVLFRIVCEAGTYVRAICHSIGASLGGAHMAELRRTRAGPFGTEQLVRMQDVADALVAWREQGDEEIRNFVLPVEAGIGHLKKVVLKDRAVASVTRGSPLYRQGIAAVQRDIAVDEMIAFMTLRGELAALGKAAQDTAGMMKVNGIAARPDRVVIEAGLYPAAR